MTMALFSQLLTAFWKWFGSLIGWSWADGCPASSDTAGAPNTTPPRSRPAAHLLLPSCVPIGHV